MSSRESVRCNENLLKESNWIQRSQKKKKKPGISNYQPADMYVKKTQTEVATTVPSHVHIYKQEDGNWTPFSDWSLISISEIFLVQVFSWSLASYYLVFIDSNPVTIYEHIQLPPALQ